MQVRPGGLVGAETHEPLQSEGAHPLLLVGELPDRPEPRDKRRAGAGEQRPGGHRALALAGAADPEAASRPPGLAVAAGGAAKALAPAQALEVGKAGLLVAEEAQELGPAAGVIAAGDRLPSRYLSHRPLDTGSTGRNRIPRTHVPMCFGRNAFRST